MATIAQDILSQELYNDTEQSGEGPGQAGGITRSVVAVQKSILRQIPSERGNSEQSGEGPGPSGGKTRSGMTTPNAQSALGGKGLKRKLKVQAIETKYEAIVAVEKGEKTKTAIVEQYSVPLNTLSTWLKNKEKIMNAFQEFNPTQKKTKTTTFSV